MKRLSWVLFFVMSTSCAGDPGFFEHTNQQFEELVDEIKTVRAKNLNYLFVMKAQESTFASTNEDKTYNLTVKMFSNSFLSPFKVSSLGWSTYVQSYIPSVDVFSNRPFPVASQMSVSDFVSLWSEGGTFAKSPPNALVDHAEQRVVGTLQTAKYNVGTGNLEFTFKLVTGSVEPKVEGDYFFSMFVDSSVLDLISGKLQKVPSASAAYQTGLESSVSSLTKAHTAIGGLGMPGVEGLQKMVKSAEWSLNFYKTKTVKNISNSERNVETVLQKAAIDISGGAGQISEISQTINAGILWIYNKNKCNMAGQAMDFTQADVNTLGGLIADAVPGTSWEEFAKDAFASGVASEDMQSVFMNIAFFAGSMLGDLSCLNDSKLSKTFEGQIVYGSYTAFILDTYKQIILSKMGCETLVSSCF